MTQPKYKPLEKKDLDIPQGNVALCRSKGYPTMSNCSPLQPFINRDRWLPTKYTERHNCIRHKSFSFQWIMSMFSLVCQLTCTILNSSLFLELRKHQWTIKSFSLLLELLQHTAKRAKVAHSDFTVGVSCTGF